MTTTTMRINSYSQKSTRFLSDDDVRAMAPSAFSPVAAPDVSARYRHISTEQIIKIARDNGYAPVSVQVGRVGEDRRDFAKHLIRFQHVDAAAMTRVGDTVTQLLWRNAHDRTSAGVILAGAFRFVCLNGLVVSDGVTGKFTIRHSGNSVAEKVAEGLLEMNQYLPNAIGQIEDMSTQEMSKEAQYYMAIQVMLALWGKPGREMILPDANRTRIPAQSRVSHIGIEDDEHVIEGEVVDTEKGPIYANVTPSQLLQQRIAADGGEDLYTIFNRIQYNAVQKGGMYGSVVDKESGNISNRKSRKTRAITGMDANRRANMELWAIASEMSSQLK